MSETKFPKYVLRNPKQRLEAIDRTRKSTRAFDGLDTADLAADVTAAYVRARDQGRELEIETQSDVDALRLAAQMARMVGDRRRWTWREVVLEVAFTAVGPLVLLAAYIVTPKWRLTFWWLLAGALAGLGAALAVAVRDRVPLFSHAAGALVGSFLVGAIVVSYLAKEVTPLLDANAERELQRLTLLAIEERAHRGAGFESLLRQELTHADASSPLTLTELRSSIDGISFRLSGRHLSTSLGVEIDDGVGVLYRELPRRQREPFAEVAVGEVARCGDEVLTLSTARGQREFRGGCTEAQPGERMAVVYDLKHLWVLDRAYLPQHSVPLSDSADVVGSNWNITPRPM